MRVPSFFIPLQLSPGTGVPGIVRTDLGTHRALTLAKSRSNRARVHGDRRSISYGTWLKKCWSTVHDWVLKEAAKQARIGGRAVVLWDQDVGHLLCQYSVPCLRSSTSRTKV